MLALERQRLIVKEVEQFGAMRVADFARRFAVTEETIRRDLATLVSEGRVARSHGGVLPVQADRAEVPHHERETVQREAKQAIALEALGRVKEGDALMLDASSTALFLARLLPDIPMTVVTNSLMVIHALAEHRHARVLSTGGLYTPVSMSLTGPMAEKNLMEYHVDTLFFSCRGIDLQRGLSDPTDTSAQIKKVMLRGADRRVLLADHSKFNVRALEMIGDLTEVTEIITDAATDEDICVALRDKGVAVARVQRKEGVS